LSTDLNVRILTKSNIRTANSYLAQGGIAAAIGPGDNPAKHYADTLEAGRDHNKDDAVRTIVDEAPSLIAHHGAIFDKDPSGQWHLGLEGAHSEKRIVHSGGDATGKHVMEHLIDHLTENIIIE